MAYMASSILLITQCALLQMCRCAECSICRLSAMMVDAESPRTPFELLYTHWDECPSLVCYDNGCNMDHFILNREPEHFKDMDIAIDHFHHCEHKKCSKCYDSDEFHSLMNSSLAEQKNSFFADVRSLAVNMTQATCLWFVREKIYRMNKLQRKRNEGKVFWMRKLRDPVAEHNSVVSSSDDTM